MEIRTYYEQKTSVTQVTLVHDNRYVQALITDRAMTAARGSLKDFKREIVSGLLYEWLHRFGEAWMLQSWEEGCEPTFQMVENVIDGEVVDAEGTDVGDRRGAEAAERVLDNPNGGRLAIQAPRDRRDGDPEAEAAAE